MTLALFCSQSQKHAWDEACFIPRADDHAAVERVVRRFLALTGDDLTGGLVFRAYAPLEIVGRHPRSDIPLAAEVRTFWLDGACILSHPYWGDLALAPSPPPPAWLEGIARRIASRFFSMDVALRTDGAWTVIEVGDGQVTGLPDLALREGFYTRLHEGLAR